MVPGGTLTVVSGHQALFGIGPPSVSTTHKTWPCMWIGWLVIERLPSRTRTRSPSFTSSGAVPG